MVIKKTSKDRAPDDAAKLRDYFAALPPVPRKALRQLREAVLSAVPGGVEGISYGIPVLRLDGRPVIYYAAWAKHVSLYPMSAAIRRAHATAIKGYATSKGTIRFPFENLPTATLVKNIVRARIAEFRERGK
jgi:uncharacterized protein YdhG (YjbR/CyaY superfamily)